MIIIPDPSWYILDSSKIVEYCRCPRGFMFRNIFGWVSEAPDTHKIFGKCWHAAMEHLLLNGYTPESAIAAISAATELYRESFSEVTDSQREPKTPAYLLNAVPKYIIEHRDDNFEVLYIEVGGAVPIAKDRVVYFKMDSILRDRRSGLILSLEHKTGSRNSRQWRDQWILSMQMFTYLHVLYSLYREDEIFGIKVNGAIFTKGKGVEFVRIPIRYMPKMMDVWLDNINYIVDCIEADISALSRTSDPSEKLQCFRQNYENCTSYYGCPYFDFCISWDAPLEHIEVAPLGMKVEFWNPVERKVKECLTF